MIQVFTKYTFWFILIMIMQLLVINNIFVYNMLHPYIYIWFILLLPVNIPMWAILILGFASGLIVDIFFYTPGLHASATVFLAFVRPFLLRLFPPKVDIKNDTSPHISSLGATNFALFLLISIVIHHAVLLFTEVFGFDEVGRTALRIIINTSITFSLLFIAEILFFPTKERI